MWNRAEELDIPLMAGSSLPLAWRDPWIEYDLETHIEEALTVGFGGIESYGYHTLEALQCMVERRTGGETGVASVAVPGRRCNVAGLRRGPVVAGLDGCGPRRHTRQARRIGAGTRQGTGGLPGGT